MNNPDQLERVRYWQGQLLASSDLRAQLQSVAELRRQHNRAVHSAYGIAIGLTPGDIKSGALSLTCGLAYDCSGRELMVPVSRQVPLPTPPITTPYLLTISYNPTLGDSTLTWQPQGTPVASDNVAIARILPGAPDPQLDSSFRPVIARPLARPQIASGQTVPGNTPWESWDENGVSLGVQSVIDTSGSGFTTIPNYFAEAVTDNPTKDFVPAWFASIADPTPDGFTLRLFMRRITRESFDILDPKTQVAKTPSGGKVSLVSGNVFVPFDWVSRLLPIAADVSVVTALSGTTATLNNPLATFASAKTLAFGNPPRVAAVTKIPAPATGFAVAIDTPANFQLANVVAKLGSSFANSRPTTVTSIDDAGNLELANPITGLAVGDQLGVAQTPSAVTAVSATTATVQNPELFSMNDIVVCVDSPVESFTPAKITGIAGASHEILTLTPMIAGLNGLHLAPVKLAGTVQSVDTEAGEVKIQVDQPKLFRAGDMVAKVLPSGVFSEPVRIQSVQSTSKSLTLSKGIAGLNLADQIGAADYRVRSTVLTVSDGGATVTVTNASLFPNNSHIVQLNDSYVPVASASVTASAGTTLSLSPPMAALQAGGIIALCSFPVTVTVQSIDPNGIVHVDSPGLIKTGDVVGAIPVHPGTAIVAAAGGSSLQLATQIPGLTAGDTLSVLTISGTVNVTPTANPSKVVLDADNRVRVGDILTDITGWREPGPVRSVAFVIDATGTDLTLFSQIDGLMVNDNLGLMSLTGSAGFWIQLRLKTLPADLTPGDEALLVGLDRLQGQTVSMFAGVEGIASTVNLVLLRVEGTPDTFTVRPEDLSASILFTRGSPLALVQNQNLYVSWLACQNPDPRPSPCPDQSISDSPCGKTTQS